MNDLRTAEAHQAYQDAPNVHNFGRVRADELPVPFYSFTLLRATDADGQEHIFHVPTAALAADPGVPLDVERLARALADTSVGESYDGTQYNPTTLRLIAEEIEHSYALGGCVRAPMV